MATPVKPAFILSLPRSGSTLLQRILASHQEISTSPEPTFLLPLVHLDRSTDTLATFDQRYVSWAVQDFIKSLPGGRATYQSLLADFATELYSAAAGDQAKYHFDKTPKYHLIAEEILELFPRSPVIVLWRNPLSVVASMMTTWGRNGGRWNLAGFRIDLYEGVVNLVEAVQRHPERFITVRYEELVQDPERVISEVLLNLDLEYDSRIIEVFGELNLAGRVQDPNLEKPEFHQLRADRVERWKEVLSNPIRVWWSQRYLRWLGAERLAVMGYELHVLLEELDAIKRTRKFLVYDLVDIPLDYFKRLFEPRLFVLKFTDWMKGRPLLDRR